MDVQVNVDLVEYGKGELDEIGHVVEPEMSPDLS